MKANKTHCCSLFVSLAVWSVCSPARAEVITVTDPPPIVPQTITPGPALLLGGMDASSAPNLSQVTAATLTLHYQAIQFYNPSLVSFSYDIHSIEYPDPNQPLSVVYHADRNEVYHDIPPLLSIQLSEYAPQTHTISLGPATTGGPTTPNYDITQLAQVNYFVASNYTDHFVEYTGNRYAEHIGYGGDFDVTVNLSPGAISYLQFTHSVDLQFTVSDSAIRLNGATLALTVPEPHSLALIGVGLAFCGTKRLRRRRAEKQRGRHCGAPPVAYGS